MILEVEAFFYQHKSQSTYQSRNEKCNPQISLYINSITNSNLVPNIIGEKPLGKCVILGRNGSLPTRFCMFSLHK